MYRFLFFSLCFLSGAFEGGFVQAQETYRNPFDFPILLSANFGELRPNHFHSGLDFKTQGVEGKPVHAVKSGYVSRIGVSPWGYGNILYVSHPDGTTTVYAHLQRFEKRIADYVKEQQYERESFAVNLTPEPGLFPVRQGEVIALSGNSGGSGGPHLHFEIRDTKSDEVMDPLLYYQDKIKDDRAPRILGLQICPAKGFGVVDGSQERQTLKLVTGKDGKQTISGKIEAWGKVGFSLRANDYITGTGNIYGVREITLSADTIVLFHSKINQYALNETRYLNSFVDYPQWRNTHAFYTNLFVEPGNKLRFIQTVNRGYIYIRKEGTYHLTLQLKDLHGNTTQLPIWIEGKEQNIEPLDTTGSTFLRWITDNIFGAKGIRLTIPKGNLYDDLHFRYSVQEPEGAIAAIHRLHDKPVPLHRSAQLSLRLQKDSLENKLQYGIVSLHNGRASWIGGTYRDGWIDGDIREMGSYTVRIDSIPPRISPVRQAQWLSKKQIAFTITDNLSGIQSYRGEIDGKFVLFEMDGKNALITYDLDRQRLKTGSHELTLTVTDACGNFSVFNHTFTW
ncbi:M23 family metallopeptidase [Parabacteroides sp. Marseille-P3160]|uniref:M23 family metallopeptidase n=1 Tax=Parabacteroides sp. Marseille-P3160 TaxID=1917887 RepID=UPI0009BA391C|nr:M23 family metallopeptidase [Parabacteroides sp. Marseille-P3160]